MTAVAGGISLGSGRLGRWRPGRRRFVAGALVALVVALLGGYLFVSNLVYDKATLVGQAWCARVMGANTPADFHAAGEDDMPNIDMSAYRMPQYETVSFTSRQPGITISGWWVPASRTAAGTGTAAPAARPAPAIVVVHGRGKCKRDAEVLLPAGMLHRAGFSVLLIDLRNHGESTADDGRFGGGVKEYMDVLGAWDWLQQARGVPASRIGLYGVSFGAATVTIATGQEPRVAATWEDSSWSDVGSALRDQLHLLGYPEWLAPGGIAIGWLLHGIDITSLSPAGAVARLNGRPFAIVHGDEDQTVPYAHAIALGEAVRAHGGTAVPWIVHGARHVRAAFVETAEYDRRLVAFFTGALGQP